MDLFDSCHPVFNSIIVYIIFVVAIVIIKPNFLYNHQNNRFREFGNGPEQTYMTLFVVSILASVLIYYFFACIAASTVKVAKGPRDYYGLSGTRNLRYRYIN